MQCDLYKENLSRPPFSIFLTEWHLHLCEITCQTNVIWNIYVELIVDDRQPVPNGSRWGNLWFSVTEEKPLLAVTLRDAVGGIVWD